MITKELQSTILAALGEARKRRHEYLCLEHLLYSLAAEPTGSRILRACGVAEASHIEVVSGQELRGLIGVSAREGVMRKAESDMLGGILGADAKCMQAADAAAAMAPLLKGRKFRAWLSTTIIDAKLHVGDEAVELNAGDSVFFEADEPHAYENTGRVEARYHNAIIYPRG